MLDRTRVTFWEEAVQLFDNISDEYFLEDLLDQSQSCKMKRTVDFEFGATKNNELNRKFSGWRHACSE